MAGICGFGDNGLAPGIHKEPRAPLSDNLSENEPQTGTDDSQTRKPKRPRKYSKKCPSSAVTEKQIKIFHASGWRNGSKGRGHQAVPGGAATCVRGPETHARHALRLRVRKGGRLGTPAPRRGRGGNVPRRDKERQRHVAGPGGRSEARPRNSTRRPRRRAGRGALLRACAKRGRSMTAHGARGGCERRSGWRGPRGRALTRVSSLRESGSTRTRTPGPRTAA